MVYPWLMLFIHQINIEHLVCPKHCSGDIVVTETEKSYFPHGTHLLEGEILKLFGRIYDMF